MAGTIRDTIIIGGGIAGFSAAMYAGRLKLKTLVIAADRGGAITLTNDISNWPGIMQIDGMSLAKNIEKHAVSYEGVEAIDRKVVRVEQRGGAYSAYTEDGKKYDAKTIIFATGTEWRKLNVPGEKEFTNRGVHYCALCDGYFYKDKTVAVIGGADSAAKDAILLTQWAKKVYIIYRGDRIHPEPVNLSRIEQKTKEKKMEIITNTNVVGILGDNFVTQVMLDKPYQGKKEFAINGIFIDIGHIPQSQLAKSLGVRLDTKENIIIDRAAKTNVRGIFAAGDVVDTKFKQAITGAAEGVLAAYSAYEYITKEEITG